MSCMGDAERQNDPKEFLKENEQISQSAKEFPLGSSN